MLTKSTTEVSQSRWQVPSGDDDNGSDSGSVYVYKLLPDAPVPVPSLGASAVATLGFLLVAGGLLALRRQQM